MVDLRSSGGQLFTGPAAIKLLASAIKLLWPKAKLLPKICSFQAQHRGLHWHWWKMVPSSHSGSTHCCSQPSSSCCDVTLSQPFDSLAAHHRFYSLLLSTQFLLLWCDSLSTRTHQLLTTGHNLTDGRNPETLLTCLLLPSALCRLWDPPSPQPPISWSQGPFPSSSLAPPRQLPHTLCRFSATCCLKTLSLSQTSPLSAPKASLK